MIAPIGTAPVTVTKAPKNLAEFKRAMQAGVTLRATFYKWREWRKMPQTDVLLTIQEANSVGFCFEPNDEAFPAAKGKPTYHRYSHAGSYRFRDDGFDVLDPTNTSAVLSSYQYAIGG